jgi:serine/threonine-protein kinase
LNVGTTFPVNFEKLRKLGEGSDSVVWAVKHEETGKELALKISTEPDPAHRLQREFAILERLDYPGVIKVSEFGEHEGLEYFTMEIIPGKPITTFMNKRRTRKDFLEVFITTLRKTATILGRLHKEGIIHIDLKPANLLVKEKGEEEGDPVLLDFGFSEDYVLSPTSEARGTTLAYAAPELFSGGEVTPAADIYSLGVIAYEILSGAMLGIQKSSQELLSYKLRTPPRFGKLDVQLPPGLEALVFRMLNPEASLRPSADEVVAEIEWITKGEKVEVKTAQMIPRLCFGGRDAETAKLEKLVFDQKKIVLLSGKQGIGKTRLLRELRFRAILDGRNVLFLEGRGAHLSILEYLASTLGILHPKIESEKEKPPDKWSRYERIFQAIDKAGFDGVILDAPTDLNDDEAGLLGYMVRAFECS